MKICGFINRPLDGVMQLKQDPVTIAVGAIAVVGTVASAVASSKAQQSANDTNVMLTRETNAQQYQIFQEQKDYQTGEREAQQEYNTPLNQRLRYEQAGINPYFALGNIDSGNTTAQTSPAAPALHAPQVQPNMAFADLLSGLSNQGTKYLESEALNMDNQAKRVDLEFKTTEKLLGLIRQRKEIQGMSIDNTAKQKQLSAIDLQIQTATEELDILRSTKNETKAQAKKRTLQMDLGNKSRELQNEYQQFVNSMNPQQLQLLKANIRSALASANLSNAKSVESAVNAALLKSTEKGVKIDNYQKNKLNWIIREGVRLDNKAKRYNLSYPSFVDKEIWSPFQGFMNGLPWNSNREGRRLNYYDPTD